MAGQIAAIIKQKDVADVLRPEMRSVAEEAVSSISMKKSEWEQQAGSFSPIFTAR
jgi:hypothetical protein